MKKQLSKRKSKLKISEVNKKSEAQKIMKSY